MTKPRMQRFKARVVGDKMYEVHTIAENLTEARKNIAHQRQRPTDVIVEVKQVSWREK